MSSRWECVIGIEIHAQLKTKSKLFSSDPNDFGSGDNENTHPISLGMPGTLPVLNRHAVDQAVKACVALSCEIHRNNRFVRKNYFYPDLPKGYQISQLQDPIGQGGCLEFYYNEELVSVPLERAHMEEDAGKSSHFGDHTLLDFNRAGTPLLEIVSKPKIHSPQMAAEYARNMRQLLRYIDVCDGNLEEGSMRCDCNISIRPRGETKLNTKVEIKNINSFRFVEKALEYEFQRQVDVVDSGGEVVQETRSYDSTKNKTYSMRSKEEAEDYRYFPDPDLLPMDLDDQWIETVKQGLPELPSQRVKRLVGDYKITYGAAATITEDVEIADYFESACEVSGEAKITANWILGDWLKEFNEKNIPLKEFPVPPEAFGRLIRKVAEGKISGKIAKTVFSEMVEKGEEAEEVIARLGLRKIDNPAVIKTLLEEIIAQCPEQLKEYRSGKVKLFGFFVGQIMKATNGQADPVITNKLLKEILDGDS